MCIKKQDYNSYYDHLIVVNGKSVKIIPFDNLEGIIESTWIKHPFKVLYEVRYFMDGKICSDYFNSEELKIDEL